MHNDLTTAYESLAQKVSSYNLANATPLELSVLGGYSRELAGYARKLALQHKDDAVKRSHYAEREHMHEETATELYERLDDIQRDT
jgi:hypothetical protein